MEKKVSKDFQAMNTLIASELARKGVKTAAEGDASTAIADHKEYSELLENVLSEDKKESWDPNDVILD